MQIATQSTPFKLIVGCALASALAGCGRPATADRPAASSSSAEQPESPAAKESPPSQPPATNTPSTATERHAPNLPAVQPTKAEASSPAIAISAEATDDVVRPPATVAEAAKAIDLSTFPLMPGAEVTDRYRVVASLSVRVPADVKTAYEFHRQELLKRQWKESDRTTISDQSANASFTRDGFRLNLSMFNAEPGKVLVMLNNMGSLNLAKLPSPPGAKLQYSFPSVASFVTDAGVQETTAAVRQLLMDQGWEPYGVVGDVMSFKQNAVELSARVLSPPAQPGKTVIDYSCQQLSCDLPAPPEAERVDYDDGLKRVISYVTGDPDRIVAFYQTKLAAAGWRPTTENPIRDRDRQMLIFRNPEKDMLTLNVVETFEKGKFSSTLEHQSAAEVAEIDRQIAAERQRLQEEKRKEEEELKKPKPKVLVTLPADARDIEATPEEIEFKLATGKAAAALDALAKQLEADGWKADQPIGGKSGGRVSFEKGDREISIHYIDPGFIPAQISISARGKFELERKP
jgi:hypothetical protein